MEMRGEETGRFWNSRVLCMHPYYAFSLSFCDRGIAATEFWLFMRGI